MSDPKAGKPGTAHFGKVARAYIMAHARYQHPELYGVDVTLADIRVTVEGHEVTLPTETEAGSARKERNLVTVRNANFNDAMCVAHRINPELQGMHLADCEVTIVVSKHGATATAKPLHQGLPPMQEQPGSLAAALRARESEFNDG